MLQSQLAVFFLNAVATLSAPHPAAATAQSYVAVSGIGDMGTPIDLNPLASALWTIHAPPCSPDLSPIGGDRPSHSGTTQLVHDENEI